MSKASDPREKGRRRILPTRERDTDEDNEIEMGAGPVDRPSSPIRATPRTSTMARRLRNRESQSQLQRQRPDVASSPRNPEQRRGSGSGSFSGGRGGGRDGENGRSDRSARDGRSSQEFPLWAPWTAEQEAYVEDFLFKCTMRLLLAQEAYYYFRRRYIFISTLALVFGAIATCTAFGNWGSQLLCEEATWLWMIIGLFSAASTAFGHFANNVLDYKEEAQKQHNTFVELNRLIREASSELTYAPSERTSYRRFIDRLTDDFNRIAEDSTIVPRGVQSAVNAAMNQEQRRQPSADAATERGRDADQRMAGLSSPDAAYFPSSRRRWATTTSPRPADASDAENGDVAAYPATSRGGESPLSDADRNNNNNRRSTNQTAASRSPPLVASSGVGAAESGSASSATRRLAAVRSASYQIIPPRRFHIRNNDLLPVAARIELRMPTFHERVSNSGGDGETTQSQSQSHDTMLHATAPATDESHSQSHADSSTHDTNHPVRFGSAIAISVPVLPTSSSAPVSLASAAATASPPPPTTVTSADEKKSPADAAAAIRRRRQRRAGNYLRRSIPLSRSTTKTRSATADARDSDTIIAANTEDDDDDDTPNRVLHVVHSTTSSLDE